MLSAPRGAPAPLSISAQTTIKKHFPKLIPKQFMHQNYIATKEEVGCLTELCCEDHLTEVEIFSLLEEQIPKYKIRSDNLTNFAGYSNQDWYTSVPSLTIATEGLGLTKDQTRETLNYFMLCGKRVSQMTRVYDDIEAVTRLLEEKEKDLELTVQIGKELLGQNNALEIKISNLEADIRACNEDRNQLMHELNKKIELIGLLTNDDDWSTNESCTTSKSVTFDLLNKKVTYLQEENKVLKVEAFQLASKTDEVEQLEKKLMSEITTQLNEASLQNENLYLEIEQQREENRLLREQAISVTSSLCEAEKRLYDLTNHNEEQRILLNITKESQNSLAVELTEFKELYKEVLLMLQEAQEQLRNQRKKVMPNIKSSYIPVISACHSESLHSELMESSLFSQNSLDSGIAGYHNLKIDPYEINNTNRELGTKYNKTFQAVRSTNKNILNHDRIKNNFTNNIPRCRMSSGQIFQKTTQYNHPDNLTYEGSFNYLNSKNGVFIDNLATHFDKNLSQNSGIPGAPGAKDLEDALKRLSPTEVLTKLSFNHRNTCDELLFSYNEPTGIRTPDSIYSTGSSRVSSSPNISSSINQWRIPKKLKIIKPVEGSQTLNHWLKLATPTLSGLLEERPGVTIRGGRGLDEIGIQIYTLSDLEEDMEENPGKQFEASGCIYTFTTSVIMHPDDRLMNSSSYISQSQKALNKESSPPSRKISCPHTPSRRNSCSTFSVNLGLAAMLNERGIKAITPSAVLTSIIPNNSPYITSCNPGILSKLPEVPQISQCSQHIAKTTFDNVSDKCNQNQPPHQRIVFSRLQKRALNSLKLVEKVENIGLHNLISSPKKKNNSFLFDIFNFNNREKESVRENSNNSYETPYFDCNQLEGILNRGMIISGNKYKSHNSKYANSETNVKHDTSGKDFNLIHLKNINCNQNVSPRQSSMRKDSNRKTFRSELNTCCAMQRSDLGTIVSFVAKNFEENYATTNNIENEIDTNDLNHEKNCNKSQSFVGSVSSLLFGRKGGWL